MPPPFHLTTMLALLMCMVCQAAVNMEEELVLGQPLYNIHPLQVAAIALGPQTTHPEQWAEPLTNEQIPYVHEVSVSSQTPQLTFHQRHPAAPQTQSETGHVVRGDFAV